MILFVELQGNWEILDIILFQLVKMYAVFKSSPSTYFAHIFLIVTPINQFIILF